MERDILLKIGAKFSILYAGATVFVIFLGSQLFGYAFGFAALVMLLGALVTVPLLFGTSDAGLDTAEAGGTVGFQGIADPSKYQPDRFVLPGRIQLSFYLIGIAAYSAVGLWIVM